MGKIVRDVKVCAVDPKGKRGSCKTVKALLDSGTRDTTLDRDLAESIGATIRKNVSRVALANGDVITVDGADVELKLSASRCGPTPVKANVIDQKTPRKDGVKLLLGQDYLQDQKVTLIFNNDGTDKAKCIR